MPAKVASAGAQPAREQWMACLDVPTAAIPGHIIKTVAEPHVPVACVPKGKNQVAKAYLLAAAPDLLAFAEGFVKAFRAGKIHRCHLDDALVAIRKAKKGN